MLQLATADQRLDVSGRSDSEHRIPMIVANTGTGDLTDVKLAGTAPPAGTSRSTRSRSTSVKPNETAQVTAIVKPASDAVAGDYALTIRASAGSQSSSVDLRYSLKGSTHPRVRGGRRDRAGVRRPGRRCSCKFGRR